MITHSYALCVMLCIVVSVYPVTFEGDSVVVVNDLRVNVKKAIPNDVVKLKESKKDIVNENGYKETLNVLENAFVSKNKDYLVITKIETGMGEYNILCTLNVYECKNKKKHIGTIVLELGYYANEKLFVYNDKYIFLHLSYGLDEKRAIQIYTLDGKKLFEKEYNSSGFHYAISPREDRVVTIEVKKDTEVSEERYCASIINFNTMESKELLNIEKTGRFGTNISRFSDIENMFIINHTVEQNVTMYCFRDETIIWTKTFVYKRSAYLQFSIKSEYLIYGDMLIDKNTGIVVKEHMTAEDNEKYRRRYDEEK